MNDIQLMYNVLNILLRDCWIREQDKIAAVIGNYALQSAFKIILKFIQSENDIKNNMMYSLMNEFSKICVNFAIAGNIEDEDSDKTLPLPKPPK